MIAVFSLSCVQIENVENQYTCWNYTRFENTLTECHNLSFYTCMAFWLVGQKQRQ